MKRLYPPRLSAYCCALFLVLALFACPAGAAVHQVLFAGYDRVYVDATGTTPIPLDGNTPYFTALYDDQQHILIIQAHGQATFWAQDMGQMLPAAGSGLAYIFQLWALANGDFGATEIAGAVVGGVQYTNFNFANTAMPPFEIILGMRNGSTTINWGRFTYGAGQPYGEFYLENANNPPGSNWDTFVIMERPGLQGGFIQPEQRYDLPPITGLDLRILDAQATDGVVRSFYAFGAAPCFQQGPGWGARMVLHTLNEAISMETANEVLVGVPRKLNEWVAPPLPAFRANLAPRPAAFWGAAAGGQAGAAGSPNYTGKETDPWNYFCYIQNLGRNAHQVGKDFHWAVAKRFMENKAYPLAAAGLLVAALFAGVAIIRRKGLGKDL
jgi:hypothetical protein